MGSPRWPGRGCVDTCGSGPGGVCDCMVVWLLVRIVRGRADPQGPSVPGQSESEQLIVPLLRRWWALVRSRQISIVVGIRSLSGQARIAGKASSCCTMTDRCGVMPVVVIGTVAGLYMGSRHRGDHSSLFVAIQPDARPDLSHQTTWRSTTDPNGGVTGYTYNLAAELVRVDSPGPLGDLTFTYDTLSRVATSTDGNGAVTTVTYDGMDRATTITPTGGPAVSYVFDGLGNRTARSDGAGTVSTSYDTLNRIVTEAFPGGRTVSYTYDPNSNLTTLTDPAGSTTYTYNPVDLVDTLTVRSNTVTFSYHTRNRPDMTTYPNGVSVDSGYDESGRIVARTVTGPGGSGSSVIQDWAWSYTLGADDTALVQTETAGGVTTTYGYDTLDRLTSAVTPGGDAYAWSWDANNNRLTETLNSTTTSWSYNAANQITNTGYTYDPAGNRTTGGGTSSLGYDDLNRTVDLDGLAATYLGAGQNEIDSLDGDTITRALPGLAVDGARRYIRTPSGEPVGIIDGTQTPTGSSPTGWGRSPGSPTPPVLRSSTTTTPRSGPSPPPAPTPSRPSHRRTPAGTPNATPGSSTTGNAGTTPPPPPGPNPTPQAHPTDPTATPTSTATQ